MWGTALQFNNLMSNSLYVTPVKRRRRMSTKLVCGGQCGKVGCQFVGECSAALKQHLDNVMNYCPECNKGFTRLSNFFRHYRNFHKELIKEDGSSIKHPLIRAKRTSPRRLPESLSMIWKEHETCKEEGYAFIANMVRNCNCDDIKKRKRYTEEEIEYCSRIGNIEKHQLAQDILSYLLQRGMQNPGSVDEAGGILPNGFNLRPHGGLFALSLDRRDNSRPHFLKGCPTIGEGSNLRLVIMAINTQANVVSSYGENTCEYIRNAMFRSVSQKEKQNRWNLEIQSKCTDRSKSYTCCKYIYRKDSLCRQAFGDLQNFYHHALELYKQQGLLCAVSGILLEGVNAEHPFLKMSLDAINPVEGHIHGNLRWVCRGLNSTNSDKLKTYQDENDPQSAWDRETFSRYVGVNLKDIRISEPFNGSSELFTQSVYIN